MMVMDSILETLFKVKKKASVNLAQHLLCFWAAEGKRTSSLNEVDCTLSYGDPGTKGPDKATLFLQVFSFH